MLETKPQNFIEQIVETDLSSGLPSSALRFRFPPEPNGFLHIGHTKALGINFGLAEKYSAPVNLRFDDTTPSKEDQRFVDAIKKERPICIGITSMTGEQIRRGKTFSKMIREIDETIPIVWGGAHPSLLPEMTIEYKSVDLIITGEGDISFPILWLGSW